jgi:hypothetical protein
MANIARQHGEFTHMSDPHEYPYDEGSAYKVAHAALLGSVRQPPDWHAAVTATVDALVAAGFIADPTTPPSEPDHPPHPEHPDKPDKPDKPPAHHSHHSHAHKK